MSKPDLPRWPWLKLATHPALDWVETTYDAAWLEEMAKRIDAGALLNEWTLATVGLLRALADTPAALEKLNHRRKTPPRRVEGLNRAVHFLVALEHCNGRVKDALPYVAKAWGCAVATIKEDRTTHTAKTNKKQYWCDDTDDIQRPEDAKRVTEEILIAAMVTHGMTRTEALKAFDSDMRHRAKSLQK